MPFVAMSCKAAFLLLLSFLASSIVSASKLDLDLITKIHNPAVHKPEIFANAIRILTSLEASPSCHRLATSTLIDSCRSLEITGHSTANVALDTVRSIFGARLAVCELQGASALIPQDCLVMNSKTISKGIWCKQTGTRCPEKSALGQLQHAEVPQRQINQCLKALESRPQWWTSYSNARQNAVVICQAARSEVERDELLNLHKSMAGVTTDLSENLAATLENSARYTEEQKAFQEAVARMQSELMTQMESNKAQLDLTFASVTKSAESCVQFLMDKLFKGVDKTSKQMEDLSKTIQDSSQDVRLARVEVESLFQDVARNTAEMATSQTKELLAGQEAAISLRESLDTITQGDIQVIALAIADLRSTMLASSQLAAMMHDSHSLLSTDLQSLTKYVVSLSTQFEVLQVSHQATEESQQRMHQALASRLNATSDMLEEFASTVANLTGSVHSTIKQIREVDLFDLSATVLGFGLKIRRGLCVLAVGIALSILCKKAAALFVLGVGISYTIVSITSSAAGISTNDFLKIYPILVLLTNIACGAALLVGVVWSIVLWSLQYRAASEKSANTTMKAEKDYLLP